MGRVALKKLEEIISAIYPKCLHISFYYRKKLLSLYVDDSHFIDKKMEKPKLGKFITHSQDSCSIPKN